MGTARPGVPRHLPLIIGAAGQAAHVAWTVRFPS